MKQSFLDCPHKNVQQFTECCLDCGYNVYTTVDEYRKDLKKKLSSRKAAHEDIRRMEKELGIGK